VRGRIFDIIEQQLKYFMKLAAKKQFHFLLLVTLLFYGLGLVFANTLARVILLGIVYWLVIFSLVRKWQLSLWLTLVAFLIFDRWKSLEFYLIPSKLMYRPDKMVDLNYHLIFTFSDLVFFLLFFSLWRRREFFFPKKEDWNLFAFLVWGGISCLFAFQPPLAFFSWLLLLRTAALYFLAQFFLRQSNFRQHLMVLLAAGAIFEGGLAFLQVLTRGTVIGGMMSAATIGGIPVQENVDFFRAQGTFYHPNFLAVFFSLLIPLFFFSLLREKPGSFFFFLEFAAFGFSLLGLLFTLSRVAWLVIFLVLAGGLVVLNRLFPDFKARISQLSSTVGFKRLIAVSLVFLVIIFLPRVSSMLTTFSELGSGGYRLELFRRALKLMARFPLFGVGLNGFSSAMFYQLPEQFKFYPAQPHNLFLQIGAEMGIPALLLFLIFLIGKSVSFLKEERATVFNLSSVLNWGIFFSAISFLLVSLAYPTFLVHRLFDYFFIFLGSLVWQNEL